MQGSPPAGVQVVVGGRGRCSNEGVAAGEVGNHGSRVATRTGIAGKADRAGIALADADVALSLTAEDRPIRDLATTPVLEYIVATAGPSAAHHVTAPVATFHALADRTDPSCRTVLDAWYGNGGDHRCTAAQFHCHPNTVLNRLNRITQLTGLDPRHPAQLVDLVVQLAVLDRHRPSAG